MYKAKGIALTTLKILAAMLVVVFLAGFVLNMTVFKDASSSSTEEATQKASEPTSDPKPEPAPEPAPEPEPSAQVFENDTIRAEFRGMQNIGNAVFTFFVTNKTSYDVTVGTENLVVNGQYDVTGLGGTKIQPGHTASLGIAFGVEVQTPLSGPDDVQTLSGNIVMFGNGIERVGETAFSVTV